MSKMMQTVASFEIPFSRFLDEEGKLVNELPDFAKPDGYLRKLYHMMVMVRQFDKKAVALQRTGQLSTFPATTGQEAILVGMGAAMAADDILVPYYREHGAQFWRGITMEEIFLYWGGDEEGNNFKKSKEDFPICVPIASQTLHAVGAATAIKLRKQKRGVVTCIGDGGTSRGDFYEAINLAGVWDLPVVFVINNNQWAISVPVKKQTSAETLAQKAVAAGIDGMQVDGNDVLAVCDAIQSALEKARSGKGATVIEALSYRMCDHTTADDATRYQPKEEIEANKNKDPIIRLRNFLHSQGLWDEDKEKELIKKVIEEVNIAAQNYLSVAPRKPASMFEYLYKELPDLYKAQLAELEARG